MKTTAELILDIHSTIDEALADEDYFDIPLYLVVNDNLSVYYTDGSHDCNSIFSSFLDTSKSCDDIKRIVFENLIS